MTCPTPGPEWVHRIGLILVEDIGNGMGLRLTWGPATPNDYNKTTHYNIYYSSTRFGVFNEGPKAITLETSATLNVFTPGDQYYLAVKATEFDTDVFDLTQLPQTGVNVYKYPDEQTLSSAIDAYGVLVELTDASEFPSTGEILIGSEILGYTSKSGNILNVLETNRGLHGSGAETHEIGDGVVLWHGFEEENSYIQLGTAAWHPSNGTPRNESKIGELNVDADGYRSVSESALITDLSAADNSNEDFSGYDFCGYHRPSLQDSLNGSCTHSYQGGQYNGSRGFDFQDRNLGLLDTMLQVTGEPVMLLKRKWTGKRCTCIDLRREHQLYRCPICYGCGFNGGFDRYINPRPISESYTNTKGLILIRVSPHIDDVEIVQDQGLRQMMELEAWTLAIPSIRDKDILVRYSEGGEVEYFYTVLNVTRNRLLFGKTGKQLLKLKRLDKSDIIYTFPIT